MTHKPCHARRAMASKARPWLGKGTHSATEQLLRRMGSLPVAMLSFASHCDAGNDAEVVYQPTMIPGTKPRTHHGERLEFPTRDWHSDDLEQQLQRRFHASHAYL